MTSPPGHDAWADRLRAAGLRVTQPRLAVLGVVADDPHVVADQVAARVRRRIGMVSTQGVYDALHTLTTHRILRCFEPAGSAMRFEIWNGDNHHHLVCRRCSIVVDVPCAQAETPCGTPDDSAGFRVDEVEVTFWGLCSGCASPPPRS